MSAESADAVLELGEVLLRRVRLAERRRVSASRRDDVDEVGAVGVRVHRHEPRDQDAVARLRLGSHLPWRRRNCTEKQV